MLQQSQHIWYQFAMFFRDELLSWSWRRPLTLNSAPVSSGGINQLDFELKITSNVEHVIERIRGIAPLPSSDEVGTFIFLPLFCLYLKLIFGVDVFFLFKCNCCLIFKNKYQSHVCTRHYLPSPAPSATFSHHCHHYIYI